MGTTVLTISLGRPAQGTFVPLNIDGKALPSDGCLPQADTATKLLRGDSPLIVTRPANPRALQSRAQPSSELAGGFGAHMSGGEHARLGRRGKRRRVPLLERGRESKGLGIPCARCFPRGRSKQRPGRTCSRSYFGIAQFRNSDQMR